MAKYCSLLKFQASSELHLWYEEQTRRQQRSNVGTQAGRTSTQYINAGCQCNLIKETDPWGNPLRTAAEYFGWQVKCNT